MSKEFTLVGWFHQLSLWVYTLQQVRYSGSVLNNCIWICSCDLFLFELILNIIRGFRTSSNFLLERFSDYIMDDNDYFQLI